MSLVCVCVHVCACMHACVCVCSCMCVCVHVCVYTFKIGRQKEKANITFASGVKLISNSQATCCKKNMFHFLGSEYSP